MLQETTASHTKERMLEELLQDLTIDSDHENSHSDKDEDRAVCPIFIQTMVDFGLGGLTQSKKHLPDVYYC